MNRGTGRHVTFIDEAEPARTIWRIAWLEPAIATMTDRLLDAMTDRGARGTTCSATSSRSATATRCLTGAELLHNLTLLVDGSTRTT